MTSYRVMGHSVSSCCCILNSRTSKMARRF